MTGSTRGSCRAGSNVCIEEEKEEEESHGCDGEGATGQEPGARSSEQRATSKQSKHESEACGDVVQVLGAAAAACLPASTLVAGVPNHPP